MDIMRLTKLEEFLTRIVVPVTLVDPVPAHASEAPSLRSLTPC
jgi:hypothetical protein